MAIIDGLEICCEQVAVTDSADSEKIFKRNNFNATDIMFMQHKCGYGKLYESTKSTQSFTYSGTGIGTNTAVYPSLPPTLLKYRSHIYVLILSFNYAEESKK